MIEEKRASSPIVGESWLCVIHLARCSVPFSVVLRQFLFPCYTMGKRMGNLQVWYLRILLSDFYFHNLGMIPRYPAGFFISFSHVFSCPGDYRSALYIWLKNKYLFCPFLVAPNSKQQKQRYFKGCKYYKPLCRWYGKVFGRQKCHIKHRIIKTLCKTKAS